MQAGARVWHRHPGLRSQSSPRHGHRTCAVSDARPCQGEMVSTCRGNSGTRGSPRAKPHSTGLDPVPQACSLPCFPLRPWPPGVAPGDTVAPRGGTAPGPTRAAVHRVPGPDSPLPRSRTRRTRRQTRMCSVLESQTLGTKSTWRVARGRGNAPRNRAASA